MSPLHRSLLSVASENGWQHLLLELPNSLATRIRSAMYSNAFRAHVRIGRNPVFRGLKHISIGDGFVAGDGLWLEAITSVSHTDIFTSHRNWQKCIDQPLGSYFVHKARRDR